MENHELADIVKYLKVARGGVNIWVTKYLNDGIEALNKGGHSAVVAPEN
jgi:hypothetical protein